MTKWVAEAFRGPQLPDLEVSEDLQRWQAVWDVTLELCPWCYSKERDEDGVPYLKGFPPREGEIVGYRCLGEEHCQWCERVCHGDPDYQSPHK